MDSAEERALEDKPRERRRRRTVDEKRLMVEATLAPGSSIPRVAREHGVNANQLFHWRKLYQQRCLEHLTHPTPYCLLSCRGEIVLNQLCGKMEVGCPCGAILFNQSSVDQVLSISAVETPRPQPHSAQAECMRRVTRVGLSSRVFAGTPLLMHPRFVEALLPVHNICPQHR